MKPLYKVLTNDINAYKNCSQIQNPWMEKWRDNISYHEENYLPHGSGIGNCKVDIDKSSSNKVVIFSDYHVMNENGFYDGYIDFSVTIKPSLLFDFALKINGKFGKHQDIKDYLYDTFDQDLRREIEEYNF